MGSSTFTLFLRLLPLLIVQENPLPFGASAVVVVSWINPLDCSIRSFEFGVWDAEDDLQWRNTYTPPLPGQRLYATPGELSQMNLGMLGRQLPGPGLYSLRIRIIDPLYNYGPWSNAVWLLYDPTPPPRAEIDAAICDRLAGDWNGDGVIDIGDVVGILAYLFEEE